MRLFFLFFFLNFFTGSAQNYSLMESKSYIGNNGVTLPYRILLPENYDEQKKYPLVLFLHGAGERGTDNEKQLIHGVQTFLKATNRRNFPCILIAPQCPKVGYWSSVQIDRSEYPLQLNFDYKNNSIPPVLETSIELVKTIIKEEEVDKKRIYITGLSMGGMGTFEAIYRYPKLFAAAVPVCGAGEEKAYQRKQGKVPFWIFHGTKDSVVAVEHSRGMHQRLKTLKGTVIYTEYPDIGHDSWVKAYDNEELFPWLFNQKK